MSDERFFVDRFLEILEMHCSAVPQSLRYFFFSAATGEVVWHFRSQRGVPTIVQALQATTYVTGVWAVYDFVVTAIE